MRSGRAHTGTNLGPWKSVPSWCYQTWCGVVCDSEAGVVWMHGWALKPISSCLSLLFEGVWFPTLATFACEAVFACVRVVAVSFC